jgi:hypothetical protein
MAMVSRRAMLADGSWLVDLSRERDSSYGGGLALGPRIGKIAVVPKSSAGTLITNALRRQLLSFDWIVGHDRWREAASSG